MPINDGRFLMVSVMDIPCPTWGLFWHEIRQPTRTRRSWTPPAA
jgi:hypothetical protein